MKQQYPDLVVLMRHPEAEHNAKFGDDRSTEKVPNHKSPLTEKGQRQLEITGEYLKRRFEFDQVFASTFTRTQEPLKRIYPDRKPIIDSRLDEWWRGIHHLYDKDFVKRHYPHEEQTQKSEGIYHHRSPHGENGPDVEARIYGFITDLRLFYCKKHILISAHGRWISFWQRIIENWSVDEWYEDHKQTVANASLVIYAVSDGSFLKVDQIVPWEGLID